MTAIIPRATYRLQLHKDFGFAAATAILPYLRDLGVSHVYCSPITRARPGSLHGYDVADPREINPELGGREGFERFARAARALDLGLLLDIVPNHMGVIGADNPWWADVLEHGQASAYASFFDIDWQPFDPDLHGKLLLPVLGSPYGEVLEQGQLQVAWESEAGRLVLRYFDHRFPLDGGTWGVVLRLAADRAEDADTAEGLTRLAEQSDAMPARSDRGAAGTRDRAAAAARLRQSLAELMARKGLGGPVGLAVTAALERLNTEPGRDTLHALLEAQAWRLGFWRVAADEINYRRFFDINELAALRIEDEHVFEATHALALDLTAGGIVDGLRIDHPDGLRDPAQYFARLQDGHARRAAQLRPLDVLPDGDPLPLYVVAEKITAAHADQPADWRLHGTTGYRFGALVNGLFVDRTQAARMEGVWRGFSGVTERFEDMVFTAKRAVAMGALGSELTVLATRLSASPAPTGARATSASTPCVRPSPRRPPACRSTALMWSTRRPRTTGVSWTGRLHRPASAARSPTPACSTSCAPTCWASRHPAARRTPRCRCCALPGAFSSSARRWRPKAWRTVRSTATCAWCR